MTLETKGWLTPNSCNNGFKVQVDLVIDGLSPQVVHPNLAVVIVGLAPLCHNHAVIIRWRPPDGPVTRSC